MTADGVDSMLDEVHQRPFIGVCDVLRCFHYANFRNQGKSPMNVRRSRGKFLRQAPHSSTSVDSRGSTRELMQVESIQIVSAFLPQEVKDKTRIMRKCPEYSQA
jgi:hypothetical protein